MSLGRADCAAGLTDRVVCFDIGRVLVDFDVALAVRNLATATGADHARVEGALFDGAEYRAYSRGHLDARGFHETFTRRLGAAPLTFESFARAWCEMFRPIEGMDVLLAEVAARCRVFLCSNTDPLHYEYLLATTPCLKLARGVVLSFEVGAEKPDPIVYEAVRRLAGDVPLERIVFVDDRADNVVGARAAGFDAIQFTDATALRLLLVARGIDVGVDRPASRDL